MHNYISLKLRDVANASTHSAALLASQGRLCVRFFWLISHCLSVCLSVCTLDYFKRKGRIKMKLLPEVKAQSITF